MKIPTVGTIGSILLLGGIGYAAYKFLRGDWKLPSLPSLPDIPIPTPAPETIRETGVVGGIGDIIYQVTFPDTLRERVTERVETRDIPFSKAVAETVSEDIHKEGLALSLLKAPVTIGAGLGAITQQERYLQTLSDTERERAEQEESRKRLKFQTTPEGIVATALALPIVTVPLFVSDIFKAIAPTPPAPAPLTQEVVSTVKAQMISPEGKIRAPFLPSAPAIMKERLTGLGFKW